MTYGKAAPDYRDRGWNTPLPLPSGKKYPPPDGTTGNNDEVSDEVLDAWEERHQDGNIGLRMPRDGEWEVIGIDVDHYATKRGGDTLAESEMRYGPLPDTFRSTRRSVNSPSGIYFFRVPAMKKWNGKLGADVDIIQRSHRYAVVAPSVVDDQEYKWVTPRRKLMRKPPRVDQLPELPETWQRHLLKGAAIVRATKRAEDMTTSSLDDALEWMQKNLPGYSNLPSSEMARASAMEELEEEAAGGAHDMLISRSHRVIMLAVEGHHGCQSALETIQEVFRHEVLESEGARRGPESARSEIERAIVNEVEKVRSDIAEGMILISNTSGFTAEDEEEFDQLDRILKKAVAKRPEIVDPEDTADNDSGNADILVAYWGRELRGIAESPKEWVFWDNDHARWSRLPQGKLYDSVCRPAVERPLSRAADACFDAANRAEQMGDDETAAKEKQKGAAARKRATEAGNRGKMDNMLSVAQSKPGVGVSWSKFDADGLKLGVENGVLDFHRAPKGRIQDVADLLIPGRPEYHISLNAGTAFVADAQSDLWDEYLDTFLPEKKYRRFVQRVFGYSMLGGNPDRLMVFLQGGTSTGKSTILEAVMAATGEYATSVNVGEVFRERQDGGPNPALVSALPKRIITASEIGQNHYLHSDVVKRMTGTDHLSARMLYSNEVVSRQPAFTPIIATNSMPTIKDGDAALWRRLLILPFDHSVPQASATHKRLTDDPKALEAVLLWLVEGLLSYLRMGLAPDTWPEQCTARRTEFVAGTSPLQTFLAECTQKKAGSAVDANDFFGSYKAWCIAEGIPERDILLKSVLTRTLKSNGIESFRSSVYNKVTKKTFAVTKYRDITLTGKAADDD